jgi:hypothetical protein
MGFEPVAQPRKRGKSSLRIHKRGCPVTGVDSAAGTTTEPVGPSGVAEPGAVGTADIDAWADGAVALGPSGTLE